MKNKLKVWFVKKVIIKVVFAILILFVAYRTIGYASGSWECRSQWIESGMDYKYSLRGGCMVMPEKHWIPAKNYRY